MENQIALPDTYSSFDNLKKILDGQGIEINRRENRTNPRGWEKKKIARNSQSLRTFGRIIESIDFVTVPLSV